MTRRLLGLAGLALVATLAILAAPTAAEPPEETAWGSISLEGAPVDAGFLADDALVYGTTDTEAVPGATDGDCSVDAGTPDLYLIRFPGEPACLTAIDTAEETGVEGIQALDTAEQADAALVALPVDGSQTLSADNLVHYTREDDNLTEDWRTQLNGQILDVALAADGNRGAVAYETGNGNHRLVVFSPDGDRQLDRRLPGLPLDLDVSDDARFVAIGGNETDDSGSVGGWARLYDLTEDDTEPEIDRIIPRGRAGIVTSLGLTDDGEVYAGLFDGSVRWLRQGVEDREVSLGTDPVQLDVDAEGEALFAASGNETARLSVGEDDLAIDWRTRTNGTAADAFARPPHLFTLAATFDAFGPEGTPIWQITAGDAVAVNATGLGLVVASETDDGDASTGRTSVLEGRVLHRELALEQDEPITVTPGGVARGNVTLTNEGASVLNVTPSARADGLRVDAEPATVQLVPEESHELTVTVRARSDTSPGQRSVSLSTDGQPPLGDELTLDVEVTARPNVTIGLASGEVGQRDVTQGQTINVNLDLRNRGNAEAEVSLQTQQTVDDPWPTRVSPNETITVPADSLTTARVEIDIPPGADNGTENRVIIGGDSEEGAGSVEINLTVNPFQVIRIRPDSITQEMEPGATTPYDLTVENLGSVEADVRLRLQPVTADGEPCRPTAWGLALDASRVTVPAQGSQPVRVDVTGPAQIPVPEVENGTAGCTEDAQRPTLRVELRGSSDEGSRDRSLLYANVDPSLADEDEPGTNDSPLPAALLVTAIAGAATLARGAKP